MCSLCILNSKRCYDDNNDNDDNDNDDNYNDNDDTLSVLVWVRAMLVVLASW